MERERLTSPELMLWGPRERSVNPDILLINTPLSDYGEIDGKSTVYWPPMGLAYLASYLEHQGYEALVWDAEIDKISPQALAEGVAKVSPKWVGFNTFTSGMATLTIIIEHIKREVPEVHIVLGGIHATVETERLFEHHSLNGVVVVRNDGELKAAALLRGTPLSNIPGIAYRESGTVTINEEDQSWFVNINAPDSQLDRVFVPYDPTQGHLSPDGKKRAFIATSRGCPYSCTFCASSFLVREGAQVRFRAPELVVEEIIEIFSGGQRDIKFNDDLAFRDSERIEQILQPLVERGYGRASGLQLRGNGRANVIARLNEDVLGLMRNAGVMTIGMGAEQGTAHGMKRIRKNQTPQQVLLACRRLAERGITSSFNFIFGMPGQDERETQAVVALALETVLIGRRHDVDTQLDGFPLRPYPGTAVFDQLLSRGLSREEILASEHIEIPEGAPGYKQVIPTRTFADISPESELRHRQILDSLTGMSTSQLEALQATYYPLGLCLDP